ncbi:MAG: hypothetical protein ACE5KD_04890 [Candidatus Bathyarchaeia archaeon]
MRIAYNANGTANRIKEPPIKKRDQCVEPNVSQLRMPRIRTPIMPMADKIHVTQNCQERLLGGGRIRTFENNMVIASPKSIKRFAERTIW